MAGKHVSRSVVAISLVALIATLGWGVVDGRLTVRAPGSGGGAEDGLFATAGSEAGSPGAGGDVQGGVLALSEDRRSISVLDPRSGAVRGTIDLEQPATTIAPTPGGVSVFVTFADAPEVGVYSTTDYELQERISLREGVPEGLTFSEQGDTLIVTYRDSDRVSVFSHSQRELSDPYHFEVSAGGPMARNRRATRLYRQSNEGLSVIYAQNGAVIDTLDVRAAGWRFNPGHTHLWGVGEDGRPRVVAERSGNVTVVQQELAQVDAAAALAVPERGDGEEAGAGRVAALLSGGESVAILDAASAEELGKIDLPFAATRITHSGVGTVWALSADGRIAVIDPVSASVTAVRETEGLAVAALATSIVKEEGNFACF